MTSQKCGCRHKHAALKIENERLSSVMYSMQDKVKRMEAENERLDAHAKKWGIKAQQAEAENERLRKTGQHCGCVSSEDGESIIESCMFHAKQQADAKRLEWAKNNPRQFYEICQETLMSNVDEDVAIDTTMEPVVLDEISRKAAKRLTGESIRKKVDAAMEGE